MSLVIIHDEDDFLGIDYPNGDHHSVRRILVKEAQYNNNTGDVVIVKTDNGTIALNYEDTEDPNNPGSSFGSTEELWDWVMAILSSLNTPPTANAVTHITVAVTHDIIPVTHT